MIEILDVRKYSLYKAKTGPFLVFFFNRENDEAKNKPNLALISKLQSLEVKYKDVPILGFEYHTFKKRFPSEVKTCLDILIIQKKHENILFENPELDKISTILDTVRQKRYDLCKIKNKDFVNRRRLMRAWFCKSHHKKMDPSLKSDELRIHRQNSLMGIKNLGFLKNTETSEIDEKNSWKRKSTRKFIKYIEIDDLLTKNKNIYASLQQNFNKATTDSKYFNNPINTFPNLISDVKIVKSPISYIDLNSTIHQQYGFNEKSSLGNIFNQQNYSEKTFLKPKEDTLNFNTQDFLNLKPMPRIEENIRSFKCSTTITPLIKSDELCCENFESKNAKNYLIKNLLK